MRLTSNDRNAILPAEVTLSGGTASFQATFQRPDTVLTATDAADASVTGSAQVTVIPAANNGSRPQSPGNHRVPHNRLLSLPAQDFRMTW